MKEEAINTLTFRQSRKLFLTALKFAISILFIFFLINYVDYDVVLNLFINANHSLVIIAFVLTAINIFFQFKKWELLVKNLIGEENKKKILISLFHGFAAGISTPIRTGEYFGRAIVFKDKPISQIVIATAIDKFFMMMLVLFVGSITALFYLKSIGVTYYITFSLALVLMLLFILVVFLFNSPVLWKSIIPERIRKFKYFSQIKVSIQFLENVDKKFAVKLSLFTLYAYSIYIIQFGILMIAFFGGGSFLNAVWCGTLVMFAKTIIPAFGFGDLGIREGAAVFFSPVLGYTEAAGLNAALALFFMNLLIPSIVGFILALKKY